MSLLDSLGSDVQQVSDILSQGVQTYNKLYTIAKGTDMSSGPIVTAETKAPMETTTPATVEGGSVGGPLSSMNTGHWVVIGIVALVVLGPTLKKVF